MSWPAHFKESYSPPCWVSKYTSEYFTGTVALSAVPTGPSPGLQRLAGQGTGLDGTEACPVPVPGRLFIIVLIAYPPAIL